MKTKVPHFEGMDHIIISYIITEESCILMWKSNKNSFVSDKVVECEH